jgi:hypothetical protein
MSSDNAEQWARPGHIRIPVNSHNDLLVIFLNRYPINESDTVAKLSQYISVIGAFARAWNAGQPVRQPQ